jgi:8-oxo-dGTP pyrophosphatase MutT (NUDIX family)
MSHSNHRSLKSNPPLEAVGDHVHTPPTLMQKKSGFVSESTSLILLTITKPYEVLLLQRSPHASFMPNALVFPGGHVDLDDELPLHDDHTLIHHALEPWKMWGASSQQSFANGLYTALRETKEESGLIPILHNHNYLNALTSNLSKEELTKRTVDITQLRCVAQWLTPVQFKKRFHTYFWMGLCSKNINLQVDGSEIVSARWWSPAQVLHAYQQGSLELAPPTIRILHDLLGNQSPLSLVEDLSSRPYIEPICPQIHRDQSQYFLSLPGDHLYPSTHDFDSPYFTPPTRFKTDKSSPSHVNSKSKRTHRLIYNQQERWQLIDRMESFNSDRS